MIGGRRRGRSWNRDVLSVRDLTARQHIGAPGREIPREAGLCSTAIQQPTMMIVTDASKDVRVHDLALVAHRVRF